MLAYRTVFIDVACFKEPETVMRQQGREKDRNGEVVISCKKAFKEQFKCSTILLYIFIEG